jgi:hypothetical protein
MLKYKLKDLKDQKPERDNHKHHKNNTDTYEASTDYPDIFC